MCIGRATSRKRGQLMTGDSPGPGPAASYCSPGPSVRAGNTARRALEECGEHASPPTPGTEVARRFSSREHLERRTRRRTLPGRPMRPPRRARLWRRSGRCRPRKSFQALVLRRAVTLAPMGASLGNCWTKIGTRPPRRRAGGHVVRGRSAASVASKVSKAGEARRQRYHSRRPHGKKGWSSGR